MRLFLQEHKTDEMHTALMEASMDGHVEVARLLLDSGAQVSAKLVLPHAIHVVVYLYHSFREGILFGILMRLENFILLW